MNIKGPAVILKKEREKSILARHPWIFSGAIASKPDFFSDGEIFPVYSFSGEYLAQGYFHSQNSLAGRILSFNRDPIEEVLREKILQAKILRELFFDRAVTNAYRIINAEADGIPGLIVDLYSDVIVIQSSSCGIDRLKPLIVELLFEIFKPRCIYEKSTSSSRKQEGLADSEGVLRGEIPREIEILENGLKFIVSIVDGQKTGFFLDQREMRQMVKRFSMGKRVLNCFSYSGGFSLFALEGKAKSVVSVDRCPKATMLCKKNSALNCFTSHEILECDAFEFLKQSPLDFDLVILDPPAFAKKRKDIDAACRGYKEINRLVMQKIPPKSLLLTCSCSYFMEEALFQTLLFQAAMEAKREVRILSRHHHAADHPISLYHPEGNYLKSFLLYIE